MRTSVAISSLAPDPDQASALEHAQQLRLQVDGHFGDFVEEQRAAACALEIALVLARRAGEGAALVAEQFGLDQAGGDGAAVHADERPAASRAVGVQQLGGPFLARPRFPDQHHRRHRRRDPAKALRDLQHFRGFADPALGAASRHRPRRRASERCCPPAPETPRPSRCRRPSRSRLAKSLQRQDRHQRIDTS